GADDELLAEFRRQNGGAAIVAVKDGASYRRLAPHLYCVKPQSARDFSALIEDLTSNGSMPRTVGHLFEPMHSAAEQLEQGVLALHCLCKSIVTHKPKESVKIISCRKDATPEHAALHDAVAGYLKSLALENPKFSWKVISTDDRAAVAEIAQ